MSMFEKIRHRSYYCFQKRHKQCRGFRNPRRGRGRVRTADLLPCECECHEGATD